MPFASLSISVVPAKSLRSRIWFLGHQLEPVTVGLDEFEDAAAEFARSVQIVSRLPDQIGSTGGPSYRG